MRSVRNHQSLEECLEWINEHIQNDIIGDDEKKNFLAFKNILENGYCTDHGGRFLLIKKGKVWNESFDSPQDTCDFDDDWILFQIPKNL